MLGLKLLTGSRRALEAYLADEVRAQRSRDPLAPVPVVVGGTLMRPYLRRRLAELTGGHLNVRLLTVGELGLRLGHGRLVRAGRRPLPFLADRILAQQVAVESSGYFEPVAAMPGFPSVLLRTLRDLRGAGVDAAAFRAAVDEVRDPTGKLSSLAALYLEYERRRAGFFSSEDGLTVADPEALGADQLLVYGIWDPSALLLSALDALIAEVAVTVLLPRARAEAAEAIARFVDWAAGHGVEPEPLAEPDGPRTACRAAGRAPSGWRDDSVVLVSAPDPTREVQEAVGACLRWARAGVGVP